MSVRAADRTRTVHNYVTIITRWLWFLGLCTVIAAGAAFAVSKLQRPVYRATAQLVVSQQRLGSSTDAYSALLASQQLAQTYVNLINQPAVMQNAATRVGGITAEALAQRITVSGEAGTQIIHLSADDTNPKRAAQLANAVGAAFAAVQQQSVQAEYEAAQQQLDQSIAHLAAQVNSLTNQVNVLRATTPANPQLPAINAQLTAASRRLDALQTSSAELATEELTASNNIQTFQPALPPKLPDRPHTLQNTAIGALLGLVVATILVFLLEFLDDRIRTPAQVEALVGAPLLGTIGVQAPNSLLPPAVNGSRLATSMRALRTNLSFVALNKPLNLIAVTSAAPGEGKTTVAANLAVSLARAGKRTLLVDADLQDPHIHTLLRIPNRGGLSLCLLEQNYDIPLAAIPGIPNLAVLTAGPKPPNPGELLGSDRMSHLLHSLIADRKADVVIIDTPPAAAFVDAAVLAARTDGAILVIDSTRTREGPVLRAKDALARANAKIIGVVLNRASGQHADYAYLDQVDTQVPAAVGPSNSHEPSTSAGMNR